jgi:hypothetical protein
MYIYSNANTINNWLQSWQQSPTICNSCISVQKTNHGFLQPPELLIFSIDSNNVTISKIIKVARNNNKSFTLPLKGIVYLKDFHFTSRIISNKVVWFHDGQVTKDKCKNEGSITEFDNKRLTKCNDANAVLAIYAKN